jgi:hypothetical protein
MAIQYMGYSNVVGEVETNSRAMRVVNYPLDDGSLMSGSLGVQTGTMAAGLGAASEIFQFRWTSSNLCAIELITVSAGGIAAFTAGMAVFDVVFARSFTVAGTGGGTATITGNNQKLRTSMATTVLGEARTATTAALTAGTKTLDSQALASVASSTTATAGTVIVPAGTVLFSSAGNSGYPIVLAANEGVVVRATVPATGTWTGAITIKWAELSAYAV